MGSSCVKRPIIKINKQPKKDQNLFKITNSSNMREKYEPISLLGNGAFGKVRLFRNKSTKNLKFAIKTIKKETMPKDLFSFLIDEVKIISKMDHPNIVKYYETYEDEYYIHIVMEYLHGEDLFKLICAKKNQNFTEKDIAEILSCLLKALSYIHNQGIVHRDIKPENILFSTVNNNNSLKLIDFGLSTHLKSDSRFRVGSPFYMSPEIIKGEFSFKSDLWSVGVILFVMLTGKFPFNGKTNEDVFNEINNKSINIRLLNESKFSDLVKDLLLKLLIKDQNKRISVEEALIHPWFKYYLNLADKNSDKIDNQITESLKNFTRKTLFQKEALFYIAKLSKDDEIKKLKNCFLQMDKDNTGTLDYEEIKFAFKHMGIEIEEVKFRNFFKKFFYK
jgi:calcium-dependent protein kinase